MMGPRKEAQASLFYEFSLEDYVPRDHLLRSIDRFVDLGGIRAHLAEFYSHTGRPSVDPELLICMLIVSYCFGIRLERRVCEEVHLNLACGTGPLLGWLVDRKIDPHIPVVAKSGRTDGTWSRADFEWDPENDRYVCPEGHELKQFRRNYSDPNGGPTGKGTARYRAPEEVCQACPSKHRCCPNADARKITREEHEEARDVARAIAKTDAYVTSMRLRKKVEMLFAHLKRILGLSRLRLRGPCGASDEFLLAATAQNLRKFAKTFPLPQEPTAP
ncbi:transposase [Jannaschia sp. S6380]|uniref:transposase n=1 Tax=Jannaschia sp. S6380 TaxID=2926408 RepID=UPI001FF1FDBA|nr:transposase [Jannaschia sp. S6380]MCK0167274.1 transposase [Jannaschia sp. S6380]